MNHTYSQVWNAALGAYVVASEHAKRRGKRSGGKALARAALLAATGFAAGAAPWATAGPAGGNISAGSGNIAANGTTTTVTQTSGKLAINWDSFNIGSGETVNFVQPGSASIALNRVLGNQASAIYGKLNANGQVFLLNPNGILFGKGASVNVGGLVASTLNLSDANFMAGNYHFAGPAGSVVNQGSITAADGGYVALLGGQVSNQGTLSARLGNVTLAAGGDMTLDFAGDGLLSVTVNQGTLNALAENHQLIQADGGNVLLTAKAADSLIQAVVNNDGVIEARTVENRAGTIRLMGDMQNGLAKVGGTLDASAPAGGDGGFIETSAAGVRVADGAVISTLAGNGLTGTWLVDPVDFTIAAGNGGVSASGMGADLLASLINNSNVSLGTSSGGTGLGDINVNGALSWSANTTLTMSAHHDININAPITATGASAGLRLNFGNYALSGSVAAGTDYHVAAPITLSGASASLAINGANYTLLHSMAAVSQIDTMGASGNYALAQDLDAANTGYGAALAGRTAQFAGTFTGLGHTIGHLSLVNAGTGSYTQNIGLFGVVASAGMVRDIGLTNVNSSVAQPYNFGALVGLNYGTVENAYATGAMTMGAYSYRTGGLVGANFGSLTDVHAGVLLTAGANVRTIGGLVGYNAGGATIGNGYASGAIVVSNVGANNFSGGEEIGGLAGRNYGSISNAYASGNVSAASGGYGTTLVGGLLGGNDGALSNVYATGAVTGNSRVGGLIGQNTAAVTNAFATGAASGDSYVGGLVGYNVSPVYGSFWLTGNNTAGFGSNNGADVTSSIGLSSLAQAKSLSTYTNAGWSIDDVGGTASVWRIYDGDSLPLLRSFLTGVTVSADAGSKIYDGAGSAAVAGPYTVSDGGASLLGSLGYTAASANAGAYSTAAGTVTLAGLYSTQTGYDISYADFSLLINKATVSVSGATVAGKTYDGGTGASVTSAGTLTGLVGNETLTLSVAGANFADKNAGAGKSATVSGYTLADGSGLAGNYVLAATTASATADITPLTITAAITAADKSYDGTTAASTAGALSGLLAGDSVTLASSGHFLDSQPGAGKTVDVSGTLSGSDAGNYALRSNSVTTADINAIPATPAIPDVLDSRARSALAGAINSVLNVPPLASQQGAAPLATPADSGSGEALAAGGGRVAVRPDANGGVVILPDGVLTIFNGGVRLPAGIDGE